MANQDNDRLAGTEEGARGDPATAKGTVAGTGAPAPGDDETHRDRAAAGEGGPAPAKDAGPPGPGADAAGPGAGQAGGAAGSPGPGENGAAAGRSGDQGAPAPAALHRPAGFATGYAQPDPLAYPPGPAGPRAPAAGQPSPYPPYGDYGPYQEPAGYPGPAGYGQPSPVYGADQGYGSDQGYGYPPEQGYPPAEGYGPGYPPPPEYGEGQGYGYPGTYGEDIGYGQGPVYARYGEGPAYGQGPGYPEGPAYAGPAPGEGHVYGQEPGYGPARGYPPAPGPEPERQPHGPGMAQRPDRDLEDDGAEGPGRGPGMLRDQAVSQAPGREAGPGPYPPQDAYRWQPPPYEAPPESGRGRPGPYGQQARGRADVDEAAQPYGTEAGYPPRPVPDANQPARGEALTPLPAHGGEQQQMAETADDLTAEALLHGKRQAPGSGWRRALYKGTGGLIHPRESAEAVRRRDLISRVRTPVAGGHHRVAVMSLKGGVGKTTTCVSLGAVLASLRGDRIIALDANPDRGTLSDKVRLETAATVRDLLNERDQIQRYADVRAFTSQAPSRLEVLASDRDPAVSIAFSEEDYYDAARVLEHYYSISLTDCGTGLLHSAMAGVLTMADQIVLVSSPSVDGARSASATLDWLDAHDYGDLVRNAVVVLSMIRPRSKSTVDLDRLEHHFASRCRAVSRIPYDAHLEEGAEVDLEQMSPATMHAYLVLAATVGDGFAWPRRAARQPGLVPGYQQQGGQPPGSRYGWSASGGLA